MSRKARTRSSLALGLVLFVVAAIWIAGPRLVSAGEAVRGEAAAGTSGASRTAVFPLPSDFKEKLLRAGLHPRALCAAGLTSGIILPSLQAAADAMNSAPSAMDNADLSYASSRVAADALARKIQAGKASQEEIASYPALRTALESAVAARQTVLDGYFSAATANLTANQRAALTNIRANKGWELPAEYLVANRAEAEWVALRDALANERIAPGVPGSLNASAQTLLATVRADPAVSAARSSIESSLTNVTTSWNTAAGD